MAPGSFAIFSARAPGFWARCVVASAALVLSPWASAGPAIEADLQMVEYFGVSDIASSTDSEGLVGGIQQVGNGNRASIEQSGVGNLAQVWQKGDNNSATVVQDGYFNEARLWQEGVGHSASLTQTGWGNQIAAVQYGFGSVLNGSQDGVGNRAAVVLMDESRLTFSQNGNYNVIEQTVPLKTPMQIIQTGNGMDTRITPTN